jgi:hypothetical protein
LGAALWLIASAFLRSFEKGALVASAPLALTWCFKPIFGRFGVGLWAIIGTAALVTAVFAWWSFKRRPPTRLLNRFALLLVAVAIGSFDLISSGGRSGPVERGNVTAQREPDIFYLLLDGFGRTDEIKKVFGYDNAAFVAELEERGFFVPSRSRSNYCQTALSLASILNLDTIPKLVPNLTRDWRDRVALDDLVNRPRLVKELRTRGYDSVAVQTEFPAFNFDGFDLVQGEAPPVSYFETVLIEATPFQLPAGMMDSQYDHRRAMLTQGFRSLRDLAKPTAKPKFVFAHILAPHPPFVFTAGGQPMRIQKGFGYFDGSDFLANAGDASVYRKGYVNQYQWVSGQVLAVVDAILQQSKGSKPIVVLQGDHGSKLGLDQNDLAKTDVQECFSAFGAYLTNENMRSKLGDDTTPLRAIRAIFEEVAGTSLGSFDDRSYYSPFVNPLEFTNVTNRLR